MRNQVFSTEINKEREKEKEGEKNGGGRKSKRE